MLQDPNTGLHKVWLIYLRDVYNSLLAVLRWMLAFRHSLVVNDIYHDLQGRKDDTNSHHDNQRPETRAIATLYVSLALLGQVYRPWDTHNGVSSALKYCVPTIRPLMADITHILLTPCQCTVPWFSWCQGHPRNADAPLPRIPAVQLYP